MKFFAATRYAAVLVILLTEADASRSRVQQERATPVEKVVNLLKDLKSKIELDERAEQQAYDKYACWCEQSTAAKAKAIKAAEDELRALGQAMLTLKGQVATLASEIAALVEAIGANKAAQEAATALRAQQNAAFQASVAEMKEVLEALERAITVLKEATMGAAGAGAASASASASASALLQQQRSAAARSALQAALRDLPVSSPKFQLSPQQLSLLAELTEAGASASDSASLQYAPQSATVQGILGDMYDTFSADLQEAMGTEAARNRFYETFIHDKTLQLQSLEAEKADKEDQKALAEALLAEKTQSFDDTTAQKDADVAFFDETKSACISKHSDWTERSELRSEELEGISKAIEILSTDDARALFSSAIKAGKETRAEDSYDTGVNIAFPALLQLSKEARAGGEAAAPAYAVLRDTATQAHSLRLAALAVRVHEAKVGHFDEVLKSIGDMIATLKAEDLADIAKRDQCKVEYQKINSTISNVEWLIRKNEAAISKLEELISGLKGEKLLTIEQIKDVEQQITDMKQQRTEENQVFLGSKKADQDAIELLLQARAFLASYYTNHSIEMGPLQGSVKDLAFAQQAHAHSQAPVFEVSSYQAPEAVFSDKGKRKDESKGILQLMTMIIEDLNDEIKNSMKAEEQTQLEFEAQLKAANTLKRELVAKKVNLEAMIAARTQDKDDEEADFASNENDLVNEETYRDGIAPDCDWILGAFQHRSDLRAAELAGLLRAKDFLAGYKPQSESAMLQAQAGTTASASSSSLRVHRPIATA